jgi:hypothetical protein
MIVAMGVLMVSALLIAATFLTLTDDAHLSQTDLEGKRAYYAARAGIDSYLYHLNQNPNYWQTCTNDVQSATPIPGSSSPNPPQYSYAPILSNGAASCVSGNPIGSLIDSTTGTLRMKFTGYSGGSPTVSRGIVASFRKNGPLDYLWYSVYEALDSSISGFRGCNVFYRAGRSSSCNIQWGGNDVVNGPMYTQDQYLIGGAVTFGRSAGDVIASAAPGTRSADICSGSNCQSATIKGTAKPNAGTIAPPTDNSSLLTDATNYGKVYSGTTTIVLNANTATVTNCPTSAAASCLLPTLVDITQNPIIYVGNASSCTPAAYSPFNVGYPQTGGGQYYGCAGDVYVSGNYNASVTVAAANNIVITGSLTTSLTGSAVAGLVANQFVRVMHGSGCAAGQTLTNLTIDAAILALQHSFIVDHYDRCAPLGTLTINGAIAQYFRGAVGTSGGGSIQTGYVKAYAYDDRLHTLLPPYLFDIDTAGWHITRQNLCVPNGGNVTTAC